MVHVIQFIDETGRCFEFRPESFEGLLFWRLESNGRVYHSPVRVKGTEIPEVFFPGLARAALEVCGL